MRKALPIILFFVFSSIRCISQTLSNHSGGQNEAIANTSSTLSNYGAVFSNVAGLADIEDIVLSVSYRVLPNALWQNNMLASGYYPTKLGTIGAGFTRVGDDLFSQQTISLGFANRFGIASIGIKANYLTYAIEGYNSRSIPYFDIGGIAELTPSLFIGAYITNVSQTRIAEFQDERIPTLLSLGLSYRPNSKLMANIEVQQDLEYEPTFKAGLAYKFIEYFTFRTGINTLPNQQFIGFGFNPDWNSIAIDYSMSHNRFWGLGHQLSISYQVNKSEK